MKKEKEATPEAQAKKAQYNKAKLLYFLEYSEKSILKETGMSPNTLTYHMYRKQNPWQKQRKEKQADLFREALEGRRDRIDNICTLSLQTLEKFLLRQVRREDEISPKDAKLVSDMLANIHRIARLEDGEPTDIRRFEQLTPEEVKNEAKKLLLEINQNDPMMAFVMGDDEIYGPTRHKKSPVN